MARSAGGSEGPGPPAAAQETLRAIAKSEVNRPLHAGLTALEITMMQFAKESSEQKSPVKRSSSKNDKQYIHRTTPTPPIHSPALQKYISQKEIRE